MKFVNIYQYIVDH